MKRGDRTEIIMIVAMFVCAMAQTVLTVWMIVGAWQ